MNKEPKRNQAFDLLCGLCILRMMTLHAVCLTTLRQAVWWKPVMFWSFFFMSFFFFKAGYFNKGVDGPTKDFCLGKARSLMIPYLTWGLISLAINASFCLLFPNELSHALEAMLKFRWWVGGLTVGNSPLWFLLSFFCAYVLVHLLVKTVKWRTLQCLVALVLPAVSYGLFCIGNPLWMMTSNVFCGVFFFILGREWHRVLDVLSHSNGLILSAVLTILFVVLNAACHAEYEMKTNTWTGFPLLVILNTTLALTGISGLLLLLPTPRIPFISYVGQHSMVYFVSHYPILLIYAYTCIIFQHSIKRSIPDLSVMMLIALALCTLLVPVVEGMPWLSGRFKKKSKQ